MERKIRRRRCKSSSRITQLKVHTQNSVVIKKSEHKTIQYGFVSTGNQRKKTAKILIDHLLMTSNRAIMADINKVFQCVQKTQNRSCF